MPPAESSATRRRGVLAWLRLNRAQQKLGRCFAERLRQEGLSLAQFDVLAQTGSHDGLTQQALADALLVTKGNVTQLLDRMEKAGLIERCQQGRINRVHLTRAGRRLYDRAVPAQEDRIEERFDVLTREEQSTLLRLLRKLERSA